MYFGGNNDLGWAKHDKLSYERALKYTEAHRSLSGKAKMRSSGSSKHESIQVKDALYYENLGNLAKHGIGDC